MVGIRAKLKLVKFYKNFSRCSFEKLIRTLCYVLVLHYMLVLFPSFGASYRTGFLFILPIFTIVKLNILLLLCISIYSIVNLFDL